MTISLYCWGLRTDYPTELCRRAPVFEVTRIRYAPNGGRVITSATLPYCPGCLHDLQHNPNVEVKSVESIWGSDVSLDRRRTPRTDNPGRRVADGIALEA